MRSLTEPAPPLMLCLAALSLVLAYGSWRWVKRPFRKRPDELRSSSRPALVTSGVALAGLVTVGLVGNAQHDLFGDRSGRVAQSEADRLAANKGLGPHCDGGFEVWRSCRTSSEPKVVVWGDSFAMHLVPGLLASNDNLAMQQMTRSACSPVIGIAATEAGDSTPSSEACLRNNDRIIRWLQAHPGSKTVILSSPFDGLTARSITRDGKVLEGDLQAVAAALRKTVAAVRATGAQVMIVSPTVMVSWDVGRCLLRSDMLGLPTSSCDFDRPTETPAVRLLRSIEKDVPVYWLTEDLCSGPRCRPAAADIILYRDEAHLSMEGSAYLGQRHAWANRFDALAR